MHTPDRRVILIEFNELCPPLLDKWMKAGLLPNFRTFFGHSHAFVTEPDTKEPGCLEPWIQWYSLHTGLSYEQHRVFQLTDGPRGGHADVWQILSEQGKTVWNCSSMNARQIRKPGSAFLPDPWCTTEKAFPQEMEIFHRVVSHAVQEHTNKARGTNLSDFLGFGAFLGTHGLRAKTVGAVVRQLVSERMNGGATSWRRAPLLDKLQFDVFRHYFRRNRPDFATFFSNSTAHYQHAYWRHMEPEAFVNKPPPEEIAQYKDAILHGYQQMDALLGDFFGLEDDDVLLILATALSQQPFLKGEAFGGQHFYRPKDVKELLRLAGVDYVALEPVMAHQFQARFSDRAATVRAREALSRFRYRGEPLIGFAAKGENSLFFGCEVKVAVPADAAIVIEGTTRTVPFFEMFYQIPEVKSGFHHPDGVLWFKTGQHHVHPQKVSILDVLPTLLEIFQVPPRAGAMPYRGRSLLPALA